MMRAVRIKRVYYTDNNGYIICENVKDMISIQSSAVTRLIHCLKTNTKETGEDYFETLLKRLLPTKIKKLNFEYFFKHNLNNVLPKHTYSIKNNIVIIMNSKTECIIQSIII
jgi:hypothetical protein